MSRNRIPRDIVHKDSLRRPVLPAKFDVKALFEKLPVQSQRTALAKSIESIKEASNYLTAKTETMKMQARQLKNSRSNGIKSLPFLLPASFFFFIGAPLGAIIRKGGLGTPAVISVIFFVIWYVISITGEKMVEERIMSNIPALWSASLILLIIGMFLTYKASTDSVIMNIDTYLSFFRRIKDYIYKVAFQGKTKNPDNITINDEQLQT